MLSVTVRIDQKSRNILRDLAEHEGITMQAILDKAIEFYRRKRFLEEANKAYAALRSNLTAWQAEEEERISWDTTLSDGLDGET